MAGPPSFLRRRGTTPATCSPWSTAPTPRGSPNCCRPRWSSPRRTPAQWRSSGPTGSPARAAARSCLTRCGRSTRRPSWLSGARSRARPTPAVCTSGSTRTSPSARGIHQGYPKKLGSMWQTRPHPFAQGAPQVGAGGVFGATLAAGDRRLAEAVLTLREETETNGFVNSHKMAHHRIFPGIEADAPDAYAELIESGASEFEAGPAWTGDVELRLFDSPTEELSRLTVDEIIGGYYRQVGVVWNGGRSLATLTPQEATPMSGTIERRAIPAPTSRPSRTCPSTPGTGSAGSGWPRPAHSTTSHRSTRPSSRRCTPGASKRSTLPSRRRRPPSPRGLLNPAATGPRCCARWRTVWTSGSRTCRGSRPATTARCCARTGVG